jgi:prephenate dehydrogenase
MPSSALLMDVGSTKSDVVAVAQTTLAGKLSCFVPAHPIAGKEVAGIEHADADLYQNRQVILTPTASSGVLQVALAQEIWRSLGGHVFQMTPAQHDATFAAVSHVPHLLAYALINAIAAQADGAQWLAMGGPGFRDFSRIAASDPVIWRDILMANRHEVLRQTALLRQALEDFETALQQGQPKVLQQLIAKASATRAAWRLSGSSDSDV